MFEVEGNESSPEQNLESVSPESSAPEQPTPSEVVDLDSVEKFRFAGREWTPKDFQGAYMMQSDYTRKTQELSEERKYYDNLNYDLEAVRSNPSLAEKFKQIYPDKFHNILNTVLNQSQQARGQQPPTGQQTPGIDPSFMREFQELKSEMHERKVQSIQAELDATFDRMGKKYPYADQQAVLARASMLHERGDKITDKVWDAIFKSENERLTKLADQYYSKKVKEQKSANLQGRDIAAGGGTPGQEPRKPKSIREASKFALEELEGT